MGEESSRREVAPMKPARPKITGKDYSVYNPSQVQLGIRLWTESMIRSLPRQAQPRRSAPATAPK